MDSRLKIAFIGKCGTGKDSGVEYLINRYGGKKIAFADPIYDILHYAQGVCGFKEEKDRKFLQWIGTEWGREQENAVWVRLAMETANATNSNVYMSDVRFPNEFQAAKDNGFLCIKLTRNCVVDTRVGNGSNTHASETLLDTIEDCHETIDNSGTIEEFHEKLRVIVDRHRKQIGEKMQPVGALNLRKLDDIFYNVYNVSWNSDDRL